jgi:hypothetical protein
VFLFHICLASNGGRFDPVTSSGLAQYGSQPLAEILNVTHVHTHPEYTGCCPALQFGSPFPVHVGSVAHVAVQLLIDIIALVHAQTLFVKKTTHPVGRVIAGSNFVLSIVLFAIDLFQIDISAKFEFMIELSTIFIVDIESPVRFSFTTGSITTFPPALNFNTFHHASGSALGDDA